MKRALLPSLAGAIAYAGALESQWLYADRLILRQGVTGRWLAEAAVRMAADGPAWAARVQGIALHLFVAALLHRAWARLRGESADPREARWAALLFATLPLCSEAVVSLAGRGPQIATAAVLLALPIHAGKPSTRGVLSIVALQIAGLLADNCAIALAPLMLAYDALLGPPGRPDTR